MVYNFFNNKKKTSGSGIKNENIYNKELTQELTKRNFWKFYKRKIPLFFVDNIWVADLADMHLISKLIKDLDTYYVLLKKGSTLTTALKKF